MAAGAGWLAPRRGGRAARQLEHGAGRAAGRSGRARSWPPSPPSTRRSARRARPACRRRGRCRRPAAPVARRGAAAACAGAAPPARLRTVPVIRKAFGSSPFAAASDDIERPARAAMPDRVSPARTVYEPCDAGAAACAGSARREPGLLERGVALDGGRDHDRRAEHDLVVLGHAVEGGDGPRGQVVGGRDRPQRLSRLHGVRYRGRCRRGRDQQGEGEQSAGGSGARSMTSVVRVRHPSSPRAARPGNLSARRYVALQGGLHGMLRRLGRGRSQAVGPEMALVRAQFAALEPGADPLRVRAPARVLPLARPRQRARDAARGPARARRARAARAERVADRAGAGADPHRRRHVPQPGRAGGGRRRWWRSASTACSPTAAS